MGDKWTMMIVRDAFYGVSTFSGFQRRLGIARNILADRLHSLVEHDVLERAATRPDSERQAYRLTRQEKELFPVLVALTQWGDKWVLGPGKEPVRILDAETDAPIQPIAVQSRTGRYLEVNDVRFAPGPGADADTQAQLNHLNGETIGRES